MNLTAMYPGAEDTKAMENTTGAARRLTNAQPYRGPMRSHRTPIRSRENMLPDTEATPALPMSLLVRSRLSRMMGTSGAAAKVETKVVKNESHARWNDLIWGCLKENIFRTVALCSESTGKAKLGVVSMGICCVSNECPMGTSTLAIFRVLRF